MNFDEAIKKDYRIIVANSKVAKRLNKKYKNVRFISINARFGAFDAAEGFFIDQFIYSKEAKRIDKLKKMLPNVYIGPLYSKKLVTSENKAIQKIENHNPPIISIERK